MFHAHSTNTKQKGVNTVEQAKFGSYYHQTVKL